MANTRSAFRPIPARAHRPVTGDVALHSLRHDSSAPAALIPLARRPDEEDEPDERDDLPARMPRSARRYVNSKGDEVLEQGKTRYVLHSQPPPRSLRGYLLVSVGMLVTVVLFVAGSWVMNSWQTHQIEAQYGTPRTWQTDAVVGHQDSPGHPSHFIFLNLRGKVMIVELPGGESAHALIYSGPTLFGPDGQSIPVTGSFRDSNGDGRLDLVVHLQDQQIIYLNDGTVFKPQQ